MEGLEGFLIALSVYTFTVVFLGSSVTAALFVVHVVVVPLLFKYSRTFQRSIIVFLNIVHWPLNIDYEDTAANGIDGARNVPIEYHSKVDKCPVRIGVWHVLSQGSFEKLKGLFEPGIDKELMHKTLDEELATTNEPIILYCHGNSNSRAAANRIKLYKFFQKMGYHTIAFDYRGYGDSTNLLPSESGVVEDALVVYEWLHMLANRVDPPTVFVWGHSLGTAISSHLLGNLPRLSLELLERDKPLPMPRGLLLEAPFNNLADEVEAHPLCKFVYWLPYYDMAFVEPFRNDKDYQFKSDEHLSLVPSLPILILHAKDDNVVPYVVGHRLYKSIQDSRSKGGATVQMHSYEKSQRLGHLYICDAPDLADVVGDFIGKHR